MNTSKTGIVKFTNELAAFFTDKRREMPWRLPDENGRFNAYHILVSELMLQQTQVARVIPKYKAFLERFPDVVTLAEAPLADVLTAWQGLGYNRRARFLWQAAGIIVREYDGNVPYTAADLEKLPGVGKNTAGAVMAYAYNLPVVFVETNIRTVFIHQFFPNQQEVTDTAISRLVAQALAAWQQKDGSPREYYWALMDYGSHLKVAVGNLTKQSKSYARQTAFSGSRRQVRGAVLRALSEGPHTLVELRQMIGDERTEVVCTELAREGLIHHRGGHLYLGQ